MKILDELTIIIGFAGLISWIYFILTSGFLPFIAGILLIWIFMILVMIDLIQYFLYDKDE